MSSSITSSLILLFFLHIVTVPFSADFIPLKTFEAIILTVNGVLVLPISFVLLTIGPSLISAPEVSLIMLLEAVVGPIWVWLGGFEAPPIATVIGGGILIFALFIHS